MVTTYCYEPCDSLTNITADAYFNASIETSDKKEGAGSLKLSNLSAAGEAKYVVFDALTVFPSGKKVLGFWVRNTARNTSQGGQFIWRDKTSGELCFLTWVYSDGRYQWWMSWGGSGQDLKDPFNTPDQWYYIELEWTNKNLQKVWLDGVLQHTWSNFNVSFGTNLDVRISAIGGVYSFGTFLFDMVRCTDDTEYPPAYLAKKLHPFWKLVP